MSIFPPFMINPAYREGKLPTSDITFSLPVNEYYGQTCPETTGVQRMYSLGVISTFRTKFRSTRLRTDSFVLTKELFVKFREITGLTNQIPDLPQHSWRTHCPFFPSIVSMTINKVIHTNYLKLSQ